MQYRYLGEKTVQMKRCVLRMVQAAMTDATLNVVNMVSTVMCCTNTWPPRVLPVATAFLCLLSSRVFVAKVQYIGAAQLLIKVRTPTATTLKPLTPLYALDRSMEEMAFEPPKAKKDMNERRRDAVLRSRTLRS